MDTSSKNLTTIDPNLPAVDTSALNDEALILLNKLIAETDIAKVQDLTYLFNVNQNKKTLARINSISNLQDLLIAQFSKRMTERPDEISNQELMTGMKVAQDILERGQAMITGAQAAPLIQINEQHNSVNVGAESVSGLTRESRDRVKNFLMTTLAKAGLTKVTDQTEAVIDDTNEATADMAGDGEIE